MSAADNPTTNEAEKPSTETRSHLSPRASSALGTSGEPIKKCEQCGRKQPAKRTRCTACGAELPEKALSSEDAADTGATSSAPAAEAEAPPSVAASSPPAP